MFYICPCLHSTTAIYLQPGHVHRIPYSLNMDAKKKDSVCIFILLNSLQTYMKPIKSILSANPESGLASLAPNSVIVILLVNMRQILLIHEMGTNTHVH